MHNFSQRFVFHGAVAGDATANICELVFPVDHLDLAGRNALLIVALASGGFQRWLNLWSDAFFDHIAEDVLRLLDA